MSHPIFEIKRSLKVIEDETARLKKLAEGIPAVEKNINPILSFLDILQFHVGDLSDEDSEKK